MVVYDEFLDSDFSHTYPSARPLDPIYLIHISRFTYSTMFFVTKTSEWTIHTTYISILGRCFIAYPVAMDFAFVLSFANLCLFITEKSHFSQGTTENNVILYFMYTFIVIYHSKEYQVHILLL